MLDVTTDVIEEGYWWLPNAPQTKLSIYLFLTLSALEKCMSISSETGIPLEVILYDCSSNSSSIDTYLEKKTPLVEYKNLPPHKYPYFVTKQKELLDLVENTIGG